MGQQGPEAEPPPPASEGPKDEAGVAPSGHVTSSKLDPQGHPRVARPEQPQAAQRPMQAAALGSEVVLVPAADMEGSGAGGLTPDLGPVLLRLHEVQLCLAQEQLLLEDRRRQVQLEEQLWREEQLWLQQLQEEQAWVCVEGLELAMALEQLRSEGLETLQTQGQVRPSGGHGRGRLWTMFLGMVTIQATYSSHGRPGGWEPTGLCCSQVAEGHLRGPIFTFAK